MVVVNGRTKVARIEFSSMKPVIQASPSHRTGDALARMTARFIVRVPSVAVAADMPARLIVSGT